MDSIKVAERYGVFRWHADPRYRESECIKWFSRERDAIRHACKGQHLGWVVRPSSVVLKGE